MNRLVLLLALVVPSCLDGGGDQDATSGADGTADGGGTATTPMTTGMMGPENTDAACSDGFDNDGDGFIDCDDFDCTDSAPSCGGGPGTDGTAEDNDAACHDGNGFTDCDDFDCSMNPMVTVCSENTDELCSDGIDNDGDGFIDCGMAGTEPDFDCIGTAPCGAEDTPALCSDGIDNDNDGFIDCGDAGTEPDFDCPCDGGSGTDSGGSDGGSGSGSSGGSDGGSSTGG